jgi:hypothetical protein
MAVKEKYDREGGCLLVKKSMLGVGGCCCDDLKVLGGREYIYI